MTLNPDPAEPVKQAEADIALLDFVAPETKHERFIHTLVEEGMEEPRSYDWNGNKFFFTMTKTEEKPLEVMRRFQRAFVRNGVNKKAHMTRSPRSTTPSRLHRLKQASEAQRRRSAHIYEQNLERLDDFFGGGVVPTQISGDYVAMAGTTSDERADGGFEFLLEQLRSEAPVEESVRAMRFMDARYDDKSGMTTVTATWSDEELDIPGLAGERPMLGASQYDPDIPACIGCERKLRFAGEGAEEAYTSTVFHGDSSPQRTMDFYDHALGSRGWALSPASYMLEGLTRRGVAPDQGAMIRSYGRDTNFITLMSYRDEDTGRTITQVLESP